MKSQPESTVHSQVCQYLKIQYPKVLFNTDLSGIKLTIGQARKIKALRSGRAWPDLFIVEPNCGLSGLFIELKSPKVKIFKSNGEMVSDPHIREQAAMLKELQGKCYKAVFACGFDEAKRIIDDYLKN
jgi:hypothetical protein